MTGQYAFVGPALFEMRSFPNDVQQVAGGCILTASAEVWCPINTTWVRLDGSRISGWRNGEYFAFRPHLLNRWKIRHAARAWERATLSRESSK